ncbi:hypothetical protein [Flavobacterium aestuarii]|uniref:hypothetical protein n=1 Tax=Flavobacterium aestuarii TaxID=3149227 RepID=UPI0032B32FE3
MKIIETEILSLEQKLALFDLWNSQYPEREISEFEVYLKGLEETNHLLLADEFNQILAGLLVLSESRKTGLELL